MEPLWSPVVATGGNHAQIDAMRKRQKPAKSVAVGCDQLPEEFHGKEGIDGSSPSEGFAETLEIGNRLSVCKRLSRTDTRGALADVPSLGASPHRIGLVQADPNRV